MRRRLAAAAVVLAAAACSLVGIDLDEVIALQVTVPDSGRVEEGDTLQLRARALNAAGDSVPGAVITWAQLDTGKIQLDAATGRVIGVTPTASVRVQAHYQSLRSNPIALAVLAAADTIQRDGAARDTIVSADSQSAPLQVKLLDLASPPGPATPLAGRPVSFEITVPAGTTGARLSPSDPGTTTRATVKTASGGTAAVQVKRVPGQTAPDSVVVTATAVRGNGTAVPGSPVTFTVVIQP